MEKLNLTKTLYNKTQYDKVINTEFSQLASTTSTTISEETPITADIDGFFQEYDKLFFDIPKFGDTNSHEYLIKKSSEYVGPSLINSDIQALIDEINILQQQNLELNQQLINIQISSSQQL